MGIGEILGNLAIAVTVLATLGGLLFQLVGMWRGGRKTAVDNRKSEAETSASFVDSASNLVALARAVYKEESDALRVRVLALEQRLEEVMAELREVRRTSRAEVAQLEGYTTYLLNGLQEWVQHARRNKQRVVFEPVDLETWKAEHQSDADTAA